MRSRNIKPGFFKNDELAECSVYARLLFIGLWCLADREGRLEDRPKRIKAEILPYDDCNVEELLQELTHFGFIYRYKANEINCIWIPKFSNHQKPHTNEKGSELPPYDTELATMVTSSVNHGDKSFLPNTQPLGPLSLNPDSGMRNEEKESCFSFPEKIPLKEILKTWNDYKRFNNANVPALKNIKQNTQRYKHIRARWNNNPNIETWKQVIQNVMQSNFLNGNNQRGWTVDFDWIVKSEDNFIKVWEGKYEDKSKFKDNDIPLT